jgi:hypothetical protein
MLWNNIIVIPSGPRLIANLFKMYTYHYISCGTLCNVLFSVNLKFPKFQLHKFYAFHTTLINDSDTTKILNFHGYKQMGVRIVDSMVRSFIADNIDINKSTVSKETTINFFQLLNWGLYLMPLSAARMSL